MQQFHYDGLDPQGNPTNGTLAAANADDAVRKLSAIGVQVQQIRRGGATPTIVAPKPTHDPRAIPMQLRLLDRIGEERTLTEAYSNTQAAIRAASQDQCRVLDLTDVRTKKSLLHHTPVASLKDRSFAFSQIDELLRAGISPMQAFEEVGRSAPNLGLQQAFAHASRSAIEGGRISDVLELYPHTIAASDVGMVRAAEEAGFLPDGCRQIAEQAMEAHKFQRFFWFVMVVIIIVITSIPTGYYGMQAFPLAYERYEKAGMSASPQQIIGETIAHQIFAFACPITVAALALVWLAWRFGRTPKMMRWRHRIGATAPVWGNRARQENIAVFCSAMAQVGRAGIPPYRTWWLAANAVPNLHYRDRFLRLGASMREGSKMSEVANDGLLPPEFAMIVRTGELTGDMESSLMRMNELAKNSAQRAGFLARGVGCHFALVLMIILAGLWMISFAYVMYRQLPEKVLSGLEE